MAEVSSPGQESQPGHHGGTSLAHRQEDYDELKAPTTLGRCLNPEEHALLFLRISLFSSIHATSLQLYRIQHFWTPRARYDLCAHAHKERHMIKIKQELRLTGQRTTGLMIGDQLILSVLAQMRLRRGRAVCRVSAGGDTLGLRLSGGRHMTVLFKATLPL